MTTSPIWSFTTKEEDDPLPVFLTSFTAARIEQVVYLEWIVETELGNIGFILERSTKNEKKSFSEIASYKFTDQQEGRGNAAEKKIYSYIDSEIPEEQVLFYRLGDVGCNGVITYHDVVQVDTYAAISEFVLKQNLPNPFNSVTVIDYQIPVSSHVNLSIYNLMGQKIATLVNQQQTAGNHQSQWNASGFASGVYLCQLRVANNSKTKKIILMK